MRYSYLLPYVKQVALWAACAFFALVALQHIISTSIIVSAHRNSSAYRMINENADRPFVTRQLLPATVRAIAALTPRSLINRVNGMVKEGEKEVIPYLPERVQKTFARHHKRFYHICVLFVLMYGCLIGYAVVMQALAGRLFPGDSTLRLLAPFAAIAFALPYIGAGGDSKLYDIPALFLTAGYLWALARRHIPAIFIFLILGVINKETMVFVLPVCLLVLWGEWPKKKLFLLLGAQLLICAAIILTKYYLYSHLGGKNFYSLYWKNIPAFLQLFFRRSFLVSLLLLAILLLYRFKEKPFLLRAALVLVVLDFLGYMYSGMLGEYRVFTEALPPATLAALHSLAAMARAGGKEGASLGSTLDNPRSSP